MARVFAIVVFLFGLGTALSAETRVPASQTQITLSFAPLVKEAAPAVVNIYARRVVERRVSPFADDPLFSEFFRDFGQTRPQVQNSLGSGVILSADGIVVSNYHVVGMATDIRVVLNDRREFSARVLLGDEESDLAVLQLENAEDMPHLSLRDSGTVEVGELVLAIGNPFGVGQTVSSGIVSGLARSGTATGNARGYFIQTDAPINPGNSGGALIDIRGRVIGINTSILTRSGGSNGIGFAIPAALVRAFVDQARAGNTQFSRPWAGMGGQPVDADLADSFGLRVPGGMVITEMHPLSPFGEVGFAVGDVITAVDGQAVNTPAEMVYRMSVAGEGSVVAVTRVQDGQEEVVEVALIAPPEVPPRQELVLGSRTALPGLKVATVNPAVIAEYVLPLLPDGVVIIDPGPYGARIGLRRGDVLLGINSMAIEAPVDVDDALRQRTRLLVIEAQRGNRRVTLRARL